MSEINMEMRENNLGSEVNTLNNNISISGFIDEKFKFSHTFFAEDFYATKVRVMRQSGVFDYIPIIIPEILIREVLNEDVVDRFVKVTGQFRSLNVLDEKQKMHLNLFLFANNFDFSEEDEVFENEIHLKGYLCKKPVYRETTSGRQITDAMLAVHRAYNKSDYIPCIFWGRNARIMKEMKLGDKIELYGRVQSRNYVKRYSKELCEKKVTYEVSAQHFLKLEENDM